MRQSIILLISFALGLPLWASAETTITYQGQLQHQGEPYTGTPDMEFRLYDSLTGDNQIGSPIDKADVPVVDGLFQVELDFGEGAFDGGSRYLEVTVAGDALTPRQKITGSPWSHQALAVAPGSVDSAQIAAGAVGSEELAEDSVIISPGTGLAGGGQVTLGQTTEIGIAPGGVSSDELADAVAVDTIQANTVDAQTYLQDGAPFVPGPETIIQTNAPDPAEPGTIWLRMDEAGTKIWQHNPHGGTIRSVFGGNDVVYAGGWNNVIAASATDEGAFLWEHDHHSGWVDSVFERNGVVYSGSLTSDFRGSVVAADANDEGAFLWEHSHHSDNVNSVFERNDVVYSGSDDHKVIAADANDEGAFLWEHDHHESRVNSVFERNGVVYSGSDDNTVIAADASDGTKLWEHEHHSDRVRSVLKHNGVVYSGSNDNTVIAADALTGAKLWEHDHHSASVRSISERNGVVYSGSNDETIVAVTIASAMHVSDGNEWWHVDWISRAGGD